MVDTHAFRYLSKLDDKKLIQMANEINMPMIPEDSVLRKITDELFGKNNFIIHQLGVSILVCRVLADRLQRRNTTIHELFEKHLEKPPTSPKK